MFIRYFNKYFDDLENKFQKLSDLFNPYNYGYAFEIDVDKHGCTSPTKLMTLGRFSHGDITIMPDGKTVYMVDTTAGKGYLVLQKCHDFLLEFNIVEG